MRFRVNASIKRASDWIFKEPNDDYHVLFFIAAYVRNLLTFNLSRNKKQNFNNQED